MASTPPATWPPLPEPVSMVASSTDGFFTAGQMRAYAEQYAAAMREAAPPDALGAPASPSGSPLDGRVMALTQRQARMVERFSLGHTPRCSRADFDAINRAIPGVFQRESRDGADLRAGYVLTNRHKGDFALEAARKWLQRHNAEVTRPTRR
jgi:hypothetical protein